jgi:hypothetical protein
MAKKSRVPPPPRPVQAPKRRTDPKPPRTNRRYLIIAAVAALVIVGTAVAALVPRLGGSADDAKAAMVDAGCTYRTYPATTSKHVRETAKVKYNSFPPTNGEMTDEMIIFGFYTEPIVDQKPLIHNLEHGAVAIQYGRRVGPDTVAQLEELYRDDPNGLVVAQLPALRDKIALGAWNAPEPTGASGAKPDLGEGILALCPRFDESAFKTFIAKHRYKGPERPPRETLEPGAGH